MTTLNRMITYYRLYNENSAKKNLDFTRIAKTNMNFGAGQKNTKLSLTLELINNVFADLPI